MVTAPLKGCIMVSTRIPQRENAGLGLNSQEMLKKGEREKYQSSGRV